MTHPTPETPGGRPPSPPRWQVGDTYGHWTIVEYLGRYRVEGDYARTSHHYRVKCGTCGAEHVRAQHNLDNRKKHCMACAPNKRATTKRLEARKRKSGMSAEEVIALARRVWR
jgi:hypothetical protein